MLIELTTQKSLAEIDLALKEAAAKHKFGVLMVHNLQETMQKKGVEFTKPVLVYEVCNPHQAKKVLEANGAVSTALPCRISVYSEGGLTKIATLKPTELMRLFGNPELEPVAAEVEQVLVAMMQEAAG